MGMAWNNWSKISDVNCLMGLVEVFHWKYKISQKVNELEFNMTHCSTKYNGTGESRDGNGHKNQEQAY